MVAVLRPARDRQLDCGRRMQRNAEMSWTLSSHWCVFAWKSAGIIVLCIVRTFSSTVNSPSFRSVPVMGCVLCFNENQLLQVVEGGVSYHAVLVA